MKYRIVIDLNNKYIVGFLVTLFISSINYNIFASTTKNN